MSELIDATVEARLRSYEFAASMCGDRDVLKLTAKEAMQVLFPLVDAWDRAEARASYWQGQHEFAAESAARSFTKMHELQAENDRLQRVAHAAGVFAELAAERENADRLAAALRKFEPADFVHLQAADELNHGDFVVYTADAECLVVTAELDAIDHHERALAAHDALRGRTPERTSE